MSSLIIYFLCVIIAIIICSNINIIIVIIGIDNVTFMIIKIKVIVINVITVIITILKKDNRHKQEKGAKRPLF